MQPGSKDEGLTGVAKKRHLYKRLELLQQAVVRLENEKLGLEQHNTQLRNILEQVSLRVTLFKNSIAFSSHLPVRSNQQSHIY